MSIRSLYLPSTALNFFLSVAIAWQRKREYGERACLVLIDQPILCSGNKYLILLDQSENTPFAEHFVLMSDQGLRGKLLQRKNNFAFLKTLITKHKFSHIFVGNDRRIEFQYCLYQAKKNHLSVDGIYMDDGLYSYMNMTPSWRRKTDTIEFWCKKIMYPWLTHVNQIGTSKLIQKAYVMLPELLVNAFTDKHIVSLYREWFMTEEMNKLCRLSCQLFDCDSILLSRADIFLSLIHPHDMRESQNYEAKVKSKINNYLRQEKSVVVKYHPREAEKDRLRLQELGDITILPHQLALEFVLPLLGKNCLLVSGRSTLALTTKMIRPKLTQLVLLQSANENDVFSQLLETLRIPMEYYE